MQPTPGSPSTLTDDGRHRPSRPAIRTVIIMAVVGAVGLAWWIGRDTGHLEARQELVADRGASVMPFDLDATTHVFAPTDEGGVQTVIADDAADLDQVALIREHLQAEMAAFQVGDFGDPASIHGHEMPGLAVLESSTDELAILIHHLRGRGPPFANSWCPEQP